MNPSDHFSSRFQTDQSSLSTISAREPCEICLGGASCEIVERDFTRERMEEGYNYLATIPSGACNVTVVQPMKTKNNLALRWTLDKDYYFNGGWMIEKSGNYSAGGNSFQYKRPDSFQDDGANAEYIKFSSQLTLGLHVFLIVKSRNLGVKFSYVLPPIKNSEQSLTNTHEKPTTVEPKRNSYDNAAAVNPQETGQGKQQRTREEQPYASYFFGRQNSEGSSAPGWVKDLKNMLVKWKEQLDRVTVRIEAVESK